MNEILHEAHIHVNGICGNKHLLKQTDVRAIMHILADVLVEMLVH